MEVCVGGGDARDSLIGESIGSDIIFLNFYIWL